jgi:hypothetical protein
MGVLGFFAALLLAVAFGYFALVNQAPIQVSFFYPIPPQRALLHELVGYSALAGALFSAFLLVGPIWRSSRAVRGLRRQVRSLEEEIKTLQDAQRAEALDHETVRRSLEEELRQLRSPSETPALSSDSSSRLAPAGAKLLARADEEPV